MEKSNLPNTVHSNRYKNAHWTWEKNGWTQWEVEKRDGKYKKEQIRTKNTITEIKNTLDGINRRLKDSEEWISNLENRMVKITQSEQQKGKRIKNWE